MRAAAVLVAAALALAACGGSDDPETKQLDRYLTQTGPAIQPVFEGAKPLVDFLQGRAARREPYAKAALRGDAAVRGYREGRRRMAELDPPAELADEHAALLESFDDVAAAYARIAAALREGRAALDRLDVDAQPGLSEAGPKLQRWAAACASAAEDADLEKPDWLELLLEDS